MVVGLSHYVNRGSRQDLRRAGGTSGALDVERDSDVPISTQIYWQLAYQIDSGRLLPGSRLPPVRELGAALRVNPNTIRAVYRRLADAGYVTSRHGAGTHVADRPPQRRGAEALAGIVAEMLRRAAHAGLHRRRGRRGDLRRRHRAQAPRAARPGPVRRVHQRRRRLRRRAAGRRVPGPHRGRGRAARRPARAARPLPLRPRRDDDVPRRRGPGPGRRPRPGRGDARRARATSSSSTRSPGCRAGSRVGLVCASTRGADNILETLALSGTRRRRDRARRSSAATDGPRAGRPDRRPHPDVARGAGRRPRRRALARRSGSGRGRTSSTRPASSCSAARSSTSPPPGPARRRRV